MWGRGSTRAWRSSSNCWTRSCVRSRPPASCWKPCPRKGTEVGSRFEELGHILRSVSLGDKMGVCLDTCHVYSAGYDIVNDLDGVLEQFDRHVGLGKLYAIHLNDSLMPFASRKDRHARIGEGTIGWRRLRGSSTIPP
ncbi:MAG: TIM barrel protein [Bilophila wadsworthia]